MDEEGAVYSMHFENHRKIFAESIDKFLSRKVFLDVTLVCKGRKKLKAHRTVLAACSPLFEDILMDIDEHSHPVIVFDEIPERLIAMVLEFIYKGKAEMRREVVPRFIEVARRLQIRGLPGQFEAISNINNLPQRLSIDMIPASTNYGMARTAFEKDTQILVNSIRESPLPQKKLNSSNRENLIGNSTVLTKDIPEELLTGNKLPLKVKTGQITKVLNPFALPRVQRDSDSTSIEDESMPEPGPSKLSNGKETASPEKLSVTADIGNDPEDNDSDIEIIEDNPPSSIVIISDSQIVSTLEPVLQNKEDTRNKKAVNTNKPSDLECESDDSEITEPRKKKRKKIDSLSEPEEIVKDKDAEGRESPDHDNLSDRSESPEFITGGKDLPKAIVSEVKEEKSHGLSDTEYLQSSFSDLSHYCVVCKTFKKNLEVHVTRLHNELINKRKFVCKKCSKAFYLQASLDRHICNSK